MYAYGGFKSINIPLETPEKALIIDQSGLQWQGDFRNTGGMFFYPNNENDPRLPAHYSAWQQDMYQAMYDSARPAISSKNQLFINWKGVRGGIDLDQVKNAIAVEFLQALDSAAYQGDQELSASEKINFKFLKAGMGFFADGIVKEGTRASNNLTHARLKGIEQALQSAC